MKRGIKKASVRVIFIVGPTASGKSRIALYLARRLNGEIISCDSMQIYRGMGIISSAPSDKERRSIRHHLVGVISPGAVFDVSRYRRRAIAAMRGALARKRTPIFAGGTGLYMSVLLHGIFSGPPADAGMRRRLESYARRHGSARLHARLARRDAGAAAKIHPNDARRIIRALEVHALTGQPISALQPRRSGLADDARYDVRVFCLDRGRADLYRRIDRRVDEMIRHGAAEEARALMRRKLSVTARSAIGVRELCAGALPEAVALMKKNTRNFAKRQLTWFRKEGRIEWVRVAARDTPSGVASRIIARLRKG